MSSISSCLVTTPKMGDAFNLREGDRETCCKNCRHLYRKNTDGYGFCRIHNEGWSRAEVFVYDVCDDFEKW